MSYAVGTKVKLTDPRAIEDGYTEGEVVDVSTLDPEVFDLDGYEKIKDSIVLVKLAVAEDDFGGFIASINEGTPGFITVGLNEDQLAAA